MFLVFCKQAPFIDIRLLRELNYGCDGGAKTLNSFSSRITIAFTIVMISSTECSLLKMLLEVLTGTNKFPICLLSAFYGLLLNKV